MTWLTLLLNATVAAVGIGLLLALLFSRGFTKKTTKWAFVAHLAGLVVWAGAVATQATLPVGPYLSGTLGYALVQVSFIGAGATLFSLVTFCHLTLWRQLGALWGALAMLFGLYTSVILFAPQLVFSRLTVSPEGFLLLTREPLTVGVTVFLVIMLLSILQVLWTGRRSFALRQFRTVMLVVLVAAFCLNWLLPVYFDVQGTNALGPSLFLLEALAIYLIIRRPDPTAAYPMWHALQGKWVTPAQIQATAEHLQEQLRALVAHAPQALSEGQRVALSTTLQRYDSMTDVKLGQQLLPHKLAPEPLLKAFAGAAGSSVVGITLQPHNQTATLHTGNVPQLGESFFSITQTASQPATQVRLTEEPTDHLQVEWRP